MAVWKWDGDLQIGPNSIRLLSGNGTPEGAVVAPVGSLYLRTDGVVGQVLYIKESGAGNAGWVSANGGGSGLSLQTNETNNASQSLLDLHAGANITLTDNGAGRVTVSTNSSVALQTNEVSNGSQSLLDLHAGLNITLADNGSGRVTIASSTSFAWGGDGSDGAVVFDGTSTVLGIAPVSNAYLLTRDIFPSTLVVNNGATVLAANYYIQCSVSATINGTLHNNGQAAAAGFHGAPFGFSPGAGGAGGYLTSAGLGIGHSLPLPNGGPVNVGGASGGATGTGAGQQGPNPNSGAGVNFAVLRTVSVFSSWSSGAGGAGSNGAGGGSRTSGSSGGLSPAFGQPRTAAVVVNGFLARESGSLTGYAYSNTAGSAPGGGSGGGDGVNSGGGGGGGGGLGGSAGYLVLTAPAIIVGATGIISSDGGNGGAGGDGGTPTVGNCGGGGGGAGGGGGNGGVVALVYNSYTNNGGVHANGGVAGGGGAHGVGFGTGSNGTDGQAGPSGVSGLVIQIPQI